MASPSSGSVNSAGLSSAVGIRRAQGGYAGGQSGRHEPALAPRRFPFAALTVRGGIGGSTSGAA